MEDRMAESSLLNYGRLLCKKRQSGHYEEEDEEVDEKEQTEWLHGPIAQQEITALAVIMFHFAQTSISSVVRANIGLPCICSISAKVGSKAAMGAILSLLKQSYSSFEIETMPSNRSGS